MHSYIIIEYHSLDDVRKFNYSIIEEDAEIIVSSNSLYTKEEQMKIIAQFPSLIWVFNIKNGGFAYGMNEGLKIAKGDILVVMNPDVKFKNSIEPMVNYLQNHREVGIIAPKIVDEKGIIQDSFRHFITPWGFILRHIGRIKEKGELHVKDYQEPIYGDWVIGAFMMCRRDFYEKVGGLCDDYFMYCEDMDWCKRAYIAGYNVVYFPDTIIEYKGLAPLVNHGSILKYL